MAVEVDVPAGRPSATTGGVTARAELSTCGRSGMSGLASGKLGTCGSGGGANEGTAGLGGSSSWDSRALHSVDSSAGSCTKVTALVSHALLQRNSSGHDIHDRGTSTHTCSGSHTSSNRDGMPWLL